MFMIPVCTFPLPGDSLYLLSNSSQLRRKMSKCFVSIWKSKLRLFTLLNNSGKSNLKNLDLDKINGHFMKELKCQFNGFITVNHLLEGIT